MGNAHSGSALTRTTVALDSFVSELGGDIIFEKKYVRASRVPQSRLGNSYRSQLGFCTVLEDREMPTSEWLSRHQDLHQA